jgi:Kef-type K+ transport system membrane component KefB
MQALPRQLAAPLRSRIVLNHPVTRIERNTNRWQVFGPDLTASLEPLVTTFLLPLFFVYSGLNTQIGLVNNPTLWAVTLGLLIVSVAGKGVACSLAARLRKVPLRESIALGSLMNARGLIELILLNIGLQAGIITPTLFTILVLASILHAAR